MKLNFFKKRKKSPSELIENLEESIEKRESLKILADPPPPLDILPHRLVYLQDELSLVGEDIHTRQLTILKAHKIEKLKVIGKGPPNNFSAFDIDHFIEASRKMSDREYRLVLKLSSSFMHVNLDPKFHFFGNPCLISNPQGELVWGPPWNSTGSC